MRTDRSAIRGLWAAAAAGALAVAGCGGEGPMGLAVGGAGPLVISVSTGVTPTITWTGGPARRLNIAQQGGSVFWDIEALDGQVGFGAPVTHGVVPSSARELVQDALLTEGDDFRVSIVLVDGTEGSRVFRP